MVNMTQAFPSKYISSEDLAGKEPTLVISNCVMEEIGQGNDKSNKPVVYFQGAKKGMVLNKTNASTISDMYGPESDAWVGKPVTLITIWTEYQGKAMQGIRIKPIQPATPSTAAPYVDPNAPAGGPAWPGPQPETAETTDNTGAPFEDEAGGPGF